MTKKQNATLAGLAAAMLGLMVSPAPTTGQTYNPTNWVNDPFCFNPNFGSVGANSTSPSFTNNGIQRGTLYGNSPIGAALNLVSPGDAITFAGQVTLAGDINPDGNMQFRIGLYYQGTNSADTNWLGYTFGNPTGTGGGAANGLYVRNNPNPGIYSSGSPGNAMRPPCGSSSYTPGWGAGTYDFSVSVSLLSVNSQGISWKLTGVSPSAYSYSGAYTNSFALTVPPSFDQVGFMSGAALFNSASTSDNVGFKNLTVTLGKRQEPH